MGVMKVAHGSRRAEEGGGTGEGNMAAADAEAGGPTCSVAIWRCSSEAYCTSPSDASDSDGAGEPEGLPACRRSAAAARSAASAAASAFIAAAAATASS